GPTKLLLRAPRKHQESNAFLTFQRCAFSWIGVEQLRVMTKLQSANVRSDGPSILWLDPCGVRIHHAVAVRRYIEKMADRRVAQSIHVKRWRLRKSALDHHAIPAAGAIVAFGTNGVETFAAARH